MAPTGTKMPMSTPTPDGIFILPNRDYKVFRSHDPAIEELDGDSQTRNGLLKISQRDRFAFYELLGTKELIAGATSPNSNPYAVRPVEEYPMGQCSIPASSMSSGGETSRIVYCRDIELAGRSYSYRLAKIGSKTGGNVAVKCDEVRNIAEGLRKMLQSKLPVRNEPVSEDQLIASFDMMDPSMDMQSDPNFELLGKSTMAGSDWAVYIGREMNGCPMKSDTNKWVMVDGRMIGGSGSSSMAGSQPTASSSSSMTARSTSRTSMSVAVQTRPSSVVTDEGMGGPTPSPGAYYRR